MTRSPETSSFRDPGGFVFERAGVLYRQINRFGADRYDRLIDSGLYDHLRSKGALVPHEEVDEEPPDPTIAHRVIRPERVAFVSYPYEWCFGQLRDAALLTLDVQEAALDHGMSLVDASAYNVQFERGRPVFIDTLSFERLREGEPWIAYGQFCRHFLAPLALMAHRDVRLAGLARAHIDGIPLDLAAELLPAKTRLRLSLYLHIHAHARHTAKMGDKGGKTRRRGSFSERSFRGLVSSLRSAVRRLSPNGDSHWANYYETSDHYSDEALEHKEALVGKFLDEVVPESVWDLGANTGRFGRIAAARGIRTVCFDADHDCVEAAYAQAKEDSDEYLLPLLCDLANPSPALGWAHDERASLLERGPADLVMALALVHHLAIGNNVPLDRVADLFRRFGTWLIVEFVPKGDPKVESLLAWRDDVFDDYGPEGFERAFARWFDLERAETIRGTARTLYLMRAREEVHPATR